MKKTGIVLDQDAVLREYKTAYNKDTVDLNEFIMFVKYMRSRGFIIEDIDLEAVQQLSNSNAYTQEVKL